MTPNISSRLGTDTQYLKDLIADVRKGEVKIPQFQREFVWKELQALELLDSLARNYPVGSILLWRTAVKLAAERNIGDFKLPETDDMTPTNYVLDGQQRLTVIYSCLGAPDIETGFSAGYDLKEEEFVELEPQRPPYVFPLRWTFETTKLLNFRTALLAQPEEYQKRLDLLVSALTNYRLPVVTLKDLTVEEVCPIFERINSSGTKLSTFDLMVAATWTQSFNLHDEVQQIASSLDSKGFGDIDRNTVLKCLSAIHFGGIREKEILSLRDAPKDQMTALVERTKAALLKVVDLLSTEFKIYSWDFLPYEAIVVIVSCIFDTAKMLEHDQVVRLRQWFWRSAFSERYRVGGESFVSKDIQKVREFVVSNKGLPADFGGLPGVADWKRVVFRSRNSRSRAFVLALATCKPRNLTNGLLIDTAEALSGFNQKQFHHIYPRAHLIQTGYKSVTDLVPNFCLLAASQNNKISDDHPAVYLPALIKQHGETANAIFDSNLMPRPNAFNYGKENYTGFISARTKVIVTYFAQLCEGHTT